MNAAMAAPQKKSAMRSASPKMMMAEVDRADEEMESEEAIIIDAKSAS